MQNMNITEITMKLADCGGVSGREDEISQYAAELLKKYTDDITINNGSVIAVLGDKNAKPHIVIDAHTDRIGFVVTSVTEGGFLKVSNAGGIDMRILAAQQVIINGKKAVRGVICSVPPHLNHGEKKVPDISDIYIDTGLTKKEAEELISPGDTVRFACTAKKLLGNRITGGALDDRSGIAAVIYALENTDISALKCRVTVVFSAQEEIGERGAAVCAYRTAADIALAVDVSFAYSEGEKKDKCGQLGKGCMIGYAPTLDRELSRRFTELAKSENIPYQTEVMSGTTGTNADRYSVTRDGMKAVTLSIPLRYMHTPSEVIDMNDVINTGRLIAAYLKGVC